MGAVASSYFQYNHCSIQTMHPPTLIEWKNSESGFRFRSSTAIHIQAYTKLTARPFRFAVHIWVLANVGAMCLSTRALYLSPREERYEGCPAPYLV